MTGTRCPVNTARNGWTGNHIVAAVAVAVWAFAGAAHAQDAPSQVDSSVVIRAQEVAGELRLLWGETAVLLQRFASSEGEERLILDGQVERRVVRLRALLDELTDAISEIDSQGLDAVELRSLADDLLNRARTIVRDEIAAISDRLVELRVQRSTTPREELVALERALARSGEEVDGHLAALVNIGDYKVRAGLDAAADFAYADQLLPSRADRLATELEIAGESVGELTRRLQNANPSEEPRIRLELAAVQERQNASIAGLTSIVALMDRRQFEATEYKQALIRATGQFSTDVLDVGVARALMREWWDEARTWVATNAPQLVFNLLVFVLVILVFRVLSKITARLMSRAVAQARPNVPALLKQMAVGLSANAVFLTGILIGLSQLGIHVAPLLAGLGVVGFIVGFALQDTLSNFAAGMMILVYQPFDVGDVVEAGGVSGKVDRLSLVSTTILTFDNQKLIVPNRQIWGGVIRNKTSEALRRVDFEFSIGRRGDVRRAESICAEILKNHPLVLEDPAPAIIVNELAEWSVELAVRPWVKTEDYWTVLWDVNRQVNDRFEAEHISRPSPERQVMLSQAS